MNLLHIQTTIASKAARCILAARGKALVDFGLRRTHGAEAGLFAARASYIAGFAGTATVLAEPLYGIPLSGTMAHSYVEAHRTEEEAFLAFARANPGNVTLLIDTYDTLAGAHHAASAARIAAKEGIRTRAVRLDSGDLLALSKEVRKILDAEGQKDIQILASGNLDEKAIAALLDAGAPIDGFGVGTKLDTSDDAPYLECAYKLMEYEGTPRMKRSIGKETFPGRKQIFRKVEDGRMAGDTITVGRGRGGRMPACRESHGEGTEDRPTHHTRRDSSPCEGAVRDPFPSTCAGWKRPLLTRSGSPLPCFASRKKPSGPSPDRPRIQSHPHRRLFTDTASQGDGAPMPFTSSRKTGTVSSRQTARKLHNPTSGLPGTAWRFPLSDVCIRRR